jgi:hypothetical protein
MEYLLCALDDKHKLVTPLKTEFTWADELTQISGMALWYLNKSFENYYLPDQSGYEQK